MGFALAEIDVGVNKVERNPNKVGAEDGAADGKVVFDAAAEAADVGNDIID